MPAENSAIVVDVPRPENICFVVIPFHDSFNALYDAIVRAANNVDLTPQRTKDKPTLSFIKDIDRMLRAAQIVVAVCLPEPGHECLNPNVMYELGKAHALGKPTIIIASHQPKPPSDLADKYYVMYDPSGCNDIDNLVTQLENKMRALKDRTKGELVDPEWMPDIHVVHPLYIMCVRPDFFTNFTTVIAFGERVYHSFQPIDNQLAQLERKVEEICYAFPATNDQRIHEFRQVWVNYNHCFADVNRNIFENRFENRLKIVEDAFIFLDEIADEINVKASFNKAHTLFNYIHEDLNTYRKYHDDLFQSRDKDHGTLRDRRAASEVWRKVSDLSRISKTFVFNSHSLISNMLDVFIEEEHHCE